MLQTVDMSNDQRKDQRSISHRSKNRFYARKSGSGRGLNRIFPNNIIEEKERYYARETMDFMDLVIRAVSQSAASRRGTWANRANPRPPSPVHQPTLALFRNRRQPRIGRTTIPRDKSIIQPFFSKGDDLRRLEGAPDTLDSVGQEDRVIAALRNIDFEAGRPDLSFLMRVNELLPRRGRASLVIVTKNLINS